MHKMLSIKSSGIGAYFKAPKKVRRFRKSDDGTTAVYFRWNDILGSRRAAEIRTDTIKVSA